MKRQHGKLRIISLTLAMIMVMAMFVTPVAFADNNSQAQSNLDNINDQLDNLNDQLSQGKKKSTALSNEIKSLEKKIYAAESQINSLTKSINTTKAEIVEALAELDATNEALAEQSDSLNARLRAMYKNGDVGLLSVLLGSSSMSDFLTNIELVKKIYGNDAEMLQDLQAQYDEVATLKERLVTLKASLENQQEQQKTAKTTLTADKKTVSAKKSSVDKDNKELEAQIDALNEEANRLTAEILGLQGSEAYIGGNMLWPAQSSKRITSKFGMRLHPILKVNKLHTGIDIGAASGTNILAANAGRVISAGYNSSYGYMVMIDHGGGIVTLYAHSSKLLVSKGDVVARGQVIALVGSTGNSTGPHLHFEVRVNGEYKNPLNYVSAN